MNNTQNLLFNNPIIRALPTAVRETIFLRVFAFLKIPLIHWVSTRVLEMNDKKCVIKIPLNRRTKNHQNCMYFAVLATGADCAVGAMTIRQIQLTGKNVTFLFKDFKAEFLWRAEGDVIFTCEQGQEIAQLIKQAITSKERENLTVEVVAHVPAKPKDGPVAKFALTLSAKFKDRPA